MLQRLLIQLTWLIWQVFLLIYAILTGKNLRISGGFETVSDKFSNIFHRFPTRKLAPFCGVNCVKRGKLTITGNIAYPMGIIITNCVMSDNVSVKMYTPV